MVGTGVLCPPENRCDVITKLQKPNSQSPLSLQIPFRHMLSSEVFGLNPAEFAPVVLWQQARVLFKEFSE
jgi:hypothetical protein